MERARGISFEDEEVGAEDESSGDKAKGVGWAGAKFFCGIEVGGVGVCGGVGGGVAEGRLLVLLGVRTVNVGVLGVDCAFLGLSMVVVGVIGVAGVVGVIGVMGVIGVAGVLGVTGVIGVAGVAGVAGVWGADFGVVGIEISRFELFCTESD